MLWVLIGTTVLAITVFFVLLKRSQDEIKANFQRRFAGKNILMLDKSALYIARKSDGYSHFRGAGYLVLTDEELFFQRRLDTKMTVIPLGTITKVDSTRRFAGTGTIKLMLKVEFRSSAGAPDAIAWRLKDLDEWIRQITRAAKGQSRN